LDIYAEYVLLLTPVFLATATSYF